VGHRFAKSLGSLNFSALDRAKAIWVKSTLQPLAVQNAVRPPVWDHATLKKSIYSGYTRQPLDGHDHILGPTIAR